MGFPPGFASPSGHGSGSVRGWAVTVRVVDLHRGGRLRMWRPGELVMVHFDVVHLDQFAEGGSCLPLLVSEAVTIRDGLDDLLGLPRSDVDGSSIPRRVRR
jgi:hypothetical protein